MRSFYVKAGGAHSNRSALEINVMNYRPCLWRVMATVRVQLNLLIATINSTHTHIHPCQVLRVLLLRRVFEQGVYIRALNCNLLYEA